MGSGTPCASGILRKENPAPAVLARRGMGAGSACGAEEGAGSACRAIWRRGIPMGSDTHYNEQALLWKVIRFVCAVTGMRIAPRRRRELHAGSTRPP